MAARNSTGAKRAARHPGRKSARQPAKFKFKSDKAVEAMEWDEFVDYTFEALKHAEGLFTQADVAAFEQRFEGVHSRRARRAALAYLGLSGKELTDKIESDRDFAVLTAGARAAIEAYEKYLRDVADLMRTASTRLMTALCYRKDMKEVRAEGEARLRDDYVSETANG